MFVKVIMNIISMSREYYNTYIYAWTTQQFVVDGRPQHMKGYKEPIYISGPP